MIDENWDDIWPAKFNHNARVAIYGITFRGSGVIIEYNFITPDGLALCADENGNVKNMLREISYEEIITLKHRDYQKKFSEFKKAQGAKVTYDDFDEFIVDNDGFLRLVKKVFNQAEKEMKNIMTKEEERVKRQMENKEKGITGTNT